MSLVVMSSGVISLGVISGRMICRRYVNILPQGQCEGTDVELVTKSREFG